jgi:hypothetical protein
MALRAFRGSFLVAFDEADAVANEDRAEGDPPATREEILAYLKAALVLDIRLEDAGNPIGFQSAQLLFDSLRELPEDDLTKLYV